MTHCPYEAPKPVPRPAVEVEPPKPAPPPVYDVEAEETRRRKALQARERWENAENSMAAPATRSLCRRRGCRSVTSGRRPLLRIKDQPVEPVKPRGTRRLTGPESISEADLAARRGRKKWKATRPSRPLGSAAPWCRASARTSPVQPHPKVTHVRHRQSPSGVRLCLRTRSTKRVGIQPQRTESADWAHRPSAVKMVSCEERLYWFWRWGRRWSVSGTTSTKPGPQSYRKRATYTRG